MDSVDSLSSQHQEILGALQGRIEPVAASPPYRLALLVVAGAMLVLPLLYLALVGALGFGVYRHAVHNLDLFQAYPARIALFFYGAPLLVGVILLFFMVKPIFAPQVGFGAPLPLRRQDQPLLFAYVEKVCRAVGSPLPSEIRVNCQVNAWAGFRRGLRSLFGGDTTLTVGLPLAANMTLRQFSGVLAHEFGHFSQQAGMRMSYVIRSVNGWFTRVVYQRDQWDEALEHWSNEAGGWASLILFLARFFVWLTRKLLWLLMFAGHLLSCVLLRQMEFDADRHQARLAGSSTFTATMLRLRVLIPACQTALASLQESWNQGWLADDFARLVGLAAAGGDPGCERQLAVPEATSWLDTHPSDQDRIASARREGAQGLPEASEGIGDLPATVLFSDFEELSRLVTKRFYRDSLLLNLEVLELRPWVDGEPDEQPLPSYGGMVAAGAGT